MNKARMRHKGMILLGENSKGNFVFVGPRGSKSKRLGFLGAPLT